MSSILIGSWVCTNAQTETVVSSAWTVHTSALPVTYVQLVRILIHDTNQRISQNACFYQNCVKQDSTIRYEDGGGSKRFQWKSDQNRVDAGTTTNPSSPCRMLPLSQRTWDQWPNWEQDDPDLEMDEWPVAAMEQPEFSTLGQGTIRNSLRCITAGDNSSKCSMMISDLSIHSANRRTQVFYPMLIDFPQERATFTSISARAKCNTAVPKVANTHISGCARVNSKLETLSLLILTYLR